MHVVSGRAHDALERYVVPRVAQSPALRLVVHRLLDLRVPRPLYPDPSPHVSVQYLRGSGGHEFDFDVSPRIL